MATEKRHVVLGFAGVILALVGLTLSPSPEEVVPEERGISVECGDNILVLPLDTAWEKEVLDAETAALFERTAAANPALDLTMPEWWVAKTANHRMRVAVKVTRKAPRSLEDSEEVELLKPAQSGVRQIQEATVYRAPSEFGLDRILEVQSSGELENGKTEHKVNRWIERPLADGSVCSFSVFGIVETEKPALGSAGQRMLSYVVTQAYFR